jgi:hypothetical protein
MPVVQTPTTIDIYNKKPALTEGLFGKNTQISARLCLLPVPFEIDNFCSYCLSDSSFNVDFFAKYWYLTSHLPHLQMVTY